MWPKVINAVTVSQACCELHTYKFLLDCVSLVGFLQGAVFNVTDGDSPAGSQGDQEHQSSLPGVQHVIVKLPLIKWESRKVDLKPETRTNTRAKSETAAEAVELCGAGAQRG